MPNAFITINSINKTSANISFSTSGWSAPQNTSDSKTSVSGNTTVVTTTITTYGNLNYSWSFGDGGNSSSQSGTRTYKGLSVGRSNSITGSVTVTCTKSVQVNTSITTTTPGENGAPPATNTTNSTGTPSTSTITLGGSPLSFSAKTVYTQPNQLVWNVNIGDYIYEQLTATNWNKLIDQLGMYKSYKDQADKYTTYNYLKVSPGELVTASIFNQVASACNINDVAQIGEDISAMAVNSLVDAVNRD